MKKATGKTNLGDDDQGVEPDVSTPSRQAVPRVAIRLGVIGDLIAGGCPDDMGAVTGVINGVMEHALISGKAYRCDYTDLINIQLELANRTAELTAVSLELGALMADIAGAAEHRAVLAFNREVRAKERKAYVEKTL